MAHICSSTQKAWSLFSVSYKSGIAKGAITMFLLWIYFKIYQRKKRVAISFKACILKVTLYLTFLSCRVLVCFVCWYFSQHISKIIIWSSLIGCGIYITCYEEESVYRKVPREHEKDKKQKISQVELMLISVFIYTTTHRGSTLNTTISKTA